MTDTPHDPEGAMNRAAMARNMRIQGIEQRAEAARDLEAQPCPCRQCAAPAGEA